MPEPIDAFVEPARPPVRPTLRDHLDGLVGGGLVTGPRALAVVAAVAAALAALLLWPRAAAPEPELVLPQASTTLALAVAPGASTTTTAAVLVVDVVGEVRQPGVRRVDDGARIADVVEAAGGLTERADRARINLAAPVSDGERVFVPAVGQQVPTVAVGAAPAAPTSGAPTSGAGDGSAAVADAPVNINTATLEQLDTLPGVGPTTAQAIIDHRTENGPFASVDQLLDVRGIGDAKLAELRDRVVV